jgi:pyruvate kinase
MTMTKTKTKIIATLGPASDSETIIRRMMLAGMDVARLNFSHGTVTEHARRHSLVRSLNKKYRRSVKVLQDLEGLRIRIGSLLLSKTIPLKKNQKVVLASGHAETTRGIIPLDYDGSLRDIPVGGHIYIDDGTIDLVVVGRTSRYLKTEVVVAGTVKERKGINIPGAHLKFAGLTPKDKTDLAFAVTAGVDYIAQSFVRNKRDMVALREFLGGRLASCKLIAKIENRQAIRNIDEIIDASDGIMIARGDMGVCLPLYEIPMLQKMIIKKCNQRRKAVITATQMLESMTEHYRPTRAEVSDVANAVLDGTDFVMLSGETAAGRYPLEAVAMMNQIVTYTEAFR